MVAPRKVVAVAMILALFGAGCYHTRILTDARPATAYQKKTVHRLAWGLIQQNVGPPDTSNCKAGSFQEVRVSSNLLFAIVTVTTLGFWSPMVVEWRCAKDQPSGSSGALYKPPSRQ